MKSTECGLHANILLRWYLAVSSKVQPLLKWWNMDWNEIFQQRCTKI